MRIAIKYCGGCRSKYDRVGIVQLLNKELPHVEFCYVKDCEEYDGLLVIQGCLVVCASIELDKKIEKLEITPQNYENTIDLVTEFVNRLENDHGKEKEH